MTYDGLVLAAVAAELNRTILRGRVQKVRQHNATDLTLEVRAVGHTYLLFFSVDARFPRVYLTSSSLPVPQEPPNFRMLMRKYAEGAVVTAIEQSAMDRVLRVSLESSEHGPLSLVMEIMGKHSNLILLDSQDSVLGAIKHVGASISRYRQVLPGRDYRPPPGADKVDILSATPELLESLWRASLSDSVGAEDAAKWMVSTFSGFGPFLAREVSARVERDGSVGMGAAVGELGNLGELVRQETFEPVLITGSRGESVMVYPMPSVQYPAAQQHLRASINEALDALFRSVVARTAFDDEQTQLLTALRRSQAARKQALKSIDRTLGESEKANRYREIGEILLANLGAIEKGQKKAVVQDFFVPEAPEIEVEIDEKLTPQQNAERYFRRYRKSRDAAATATQRREHVMREIELLESALRDVESAESVEKLKQIRSGLVERNLLRVETVAAAPQEDEFAGHRIRRVFTPDGWEILYGENSQSNDYLTQRVAKPNDLWLHARATTGAHVVVRTAGHSGGVPRNVLVRASKIAAQNSEAKHSSMVPVDSTLRKYVRKPRGSAPGYVIYRNEKTLDINPRV